MSPLAILAIVFVVLTIMGVPLFVAVGVTTAVAIYMIDIPYTLIAQTGYGSLTPFPLLTIPLFVLAGRLMEVGGMATRMIGIATTLVGAYRGSMGLVTVFACMLFAALSGSGPATTAAIGSVTVPAMKREGYDVPFAAGITAAECVNKIIKGGISNTLPVLVSGATGGVGSIAVSLLSKLGYEVHAITGKPDENEKLTSMGATKIIARNDFMSEPLKPLDKAVYSSAVDTVGGEMLAKMVSMISNHGIVSCCGNVGGAMFTSSVFPFILRGVQLSGVDSAESPIDLKKELWNFLANEWQIDLNNQTKTVNIKEIDNEIKKILDGGQIGRVVIKHGE